MFPARRQGRQRGLASQAVDGPVRRSTGIPRLAEYRTRRGKPPSVLENDLENTQNGPWFTFRARATTTAWQTQLVLLRLSQLADYLVHLVVVLADLGRR